MDENEKICANCEYFKPLQFAVESICDNEYSEYAGNNQGEFTCEEWEERNE